MNAFYFTLIFFFLITSGLASAAPSGKGEIAGRFVLTDGSAMSGGKVFFFNDASGPPPSRYKYWRVSDFSAPIDNRGGFVAELPAGKYYLGAIKRSSGSEESGPPQEGDWFYGAEDDKGNPKAFLVKEGESIDLGTLAGAGRFSRALVKYREGVTAIEGIVRDSRGSPVTGAVVFAYTQPSMTGKPLFVSDRTSSDGKYILRVHSGGTYYLSSREKYRGGTPAPGDLAGSYGLDAFPAAVKKPGVGIEVKTGTIVKGLDIRTVRFSGASKRPEISRPESQGTVSTTTFTVTLE